MTEPKIFNLSRAAPFFKRNKGTLLLGGGLLAYIIIAGSTNACPACRIVTTAVGITDSPDSTSPSSETGSP